MTNYLKAQIEQGNLLAANKEKANEMLQSSGLQLPLEETFISFDNSIAYTTANVKYPEKHTSENISEKIHTVQAPVNTYYDDSQDEEEFDLTNHSGRDR